MYGHIPRKTPIRPRLLYFNYSIVHVTFIYFYWPLNDSVFRSTWYLIHKSRWPKIKMKNHIWGIYMVNFQMELRESGWSWATFSIFAFDLAYGARCCLHQHLQLNKCYLVVLNLDKLKIIVFHFSLMRRCSIQSIIMSQQTITVDSHQSLNQTQVQHKFRG